MALGFSILKMRHALKQAFLCLSFAFISQSAFAQMLPMQTLSQLPVSDYSNGVMSQLGYLPVGSFLTMDPTYAVRNDFTNDIDLGLTLNNWMMNFPSGFATGGAGAYQLPDGNIDHFFPMYVSQVPGGNIQAGQTVYVPLSALAEPGAAYVLNSESFRDLPTTSFEEVERETRREDRWEFTEARFCRECLGGQSPAIAAQVLPREIRQIPSQAMGPAASGSASARWSSANAPKILSLSQMRGLGQRPRAQNLRCDNIIDDETGNVGSWGEVLGRLLLSPEHKSTYFDRNTLGAFCPKFNQLSEQRKLQAWVWFWTALGAEESQCTLSQHHSTHSGRTRINPRAGYGLWTAEKSSTVRRGRYNSGNGDCRDISTIEGQALCAVTTMQETQLEYGKSAYGYSSSYWGPTRPYSGKYGNRAEKQMMPHMRRFAECF